MKRSTVIAALLLCAAFGTARAEQVYEPPATGAVVIVIPSARVEEREERAARALAERRQQMIDECEENHGSEVDCKREVDTELRAEGLQQGARIIQLRPAR